MVVLVLLSAVPAWPGPVWARRGTRTCPRPAPPGEALTALEAARWSACKLRAGALVTGILGLAFTAQAVTALVFYEVSERRTRPAGSPPEPFASRTYNIVAGVLGTGMLISTATLLVVAHLRVQAVRRAPVSLQPAPGPPGALGTGLSWSF
jgi:hypothetical protein